MKLRPPFSPLLRCSTLSLNVASVRAACSAGAGGDARQTALAGRDAQLTGACGVAFDPAERRVALAVSHDGWLAPPAGVT